MKSYRPSKRQRKENPPSWLENESLAFLSSPLGGTIRTPVASKHDKDLFMDRLQKEIIPHYFISKDKEKNVTEGEKAVSKALKKCVVLGTNQCTRRLEMILAAATGDAKEIPSLPYLIVLARDVYPPTILSHVPVMVQQLQLQIDAKRNSTSSPQTNHSGSLPVLLLPGQASQELGSLLGTKRVSVMIFMSSSSISGGCEDSGDANTNQDVNDKVTSFVQFVTKTLKLQ